MVLKMFINLFLIGVGFYTTTNFKQATKWALKIGKRNRTRGKSNFILYL